MNARNVLHVNTVEETASYRNAVAEIIRRVLADNSTPADTYTLVQIADAIDVSLGTISNAANKKADLSPTYLKRIGERFGAHMLDPYLALMGARAVPIDAAPKRDILPVMTRAQLRIVEARDPASPGGPRETLQEQSRFLPDLLTLQTELEAVICDIRRRLAA